MLDERKAAILRAVVEEYIDTAQPVGSGHVAAAQGVRVSSATVRNDMAVLEQEGYLRQPHTSAGRVPTDKGYRYFVDHFASPTLDNARAQQVKAFFSRAHGELEHLLQQTTQLLSDVTASAAVVVGPPHEAATIRSVQLVGLSSHVALAVFVLSNGVVEKFTVELADETADADVADASVHLNTHLVGHTLAAVPSVPTTGSRVTDRVVSAARAVLAAPGLEHDAEHVYVGGASRMAVAFDAVETVRVVLATLEQQLVVVTLLEDLIGRGLNVAIGGELGVVPLSECALVIAPYEIEGERAGTVGVLGPTRMNYPQALAAVAVVGKRLGRRLTEG